MKPEDAKGLDPSAVTSFSQYPKESLVMDENKVADSSEEIKDAAKVAIGQATGDGEADKVVGKIQNATSGFSDAVRDTEAMKSAGLLYSPGPRLQRA
jgi:uncharacterized protein YjbJ (UPF0337 family)